jgi:drug/metabolite transporter (DMT)-like permease
MKDQNKSVIYALAACLIWGTVYVAIKVGLNHGMKPLTFAGIRFLAGGLLLLLFAYLTGRLKVGMRDIWALAGLGLLQTALQNALFFEGVRLTGAGVSAIFINTAPFFVILIAPFFFRVSRITSARLAGAAVGFAGVMIASYGPGMLTRGYWLGISVLVLSAITWALSSIAAKKLMEARDTLTVTGMQMALGAVPLLAAGRIFEGRVMAGADATAIGSLVYLVIFATSIPFLAWYEALRLGEVGRVSVFGFLLPILGVVSGWLILGEPLSTGMLLGMTLVAFGIIMVNVQA